MNCQRCKSERVLCGGGKSSDMNEFWVGDANVMTDRVDYQGSRKPRVECYVPYDLNIGGGDYIDIKVCLDCGQMQGEWPIPPELPLLFGEDV